mmetsp:Transcript_37511/g.105926  ORF Transcript_37511/g.105926 Transcript_37511/m.105926 type:complete len:302 (-) Transcript_37511:1116-2021(-)
MGVWAHAQQRLGEVGARVPRQRWRKLRVQAHAAGVGAVQHWAFGVEGGVAERQPGDHCQEQLRLVGHGHQHEEVAQGNLHCVHKDGHCVELSLAHRGVLGKRAPHHLPAGIDNELHGNAEHEGDEDAGGQLGPRVQYKPVHQVGYAGLPLPGPDMLEASHPHHDGGDVAVAHGLSRGGAGRLLWALQGAVHAVERLAVLADVFVRPPAILPHTHSFLSAAVLRKAGGRHAGHPAVHLPVGARLLVAEPEYRGGIPAASCRGGLLRGAAQKGLHSLAAVLVPRHVAVHQHGRAHRHKHPPVP